MLSRHDTVIVESQSSICFLSLDLKTMPKLQKLLQMLAANFLLTTDVVPFARAYSQNGDHTLTYEVGAHGLLYVTIINNRLLSVDYWNSQRG